MIRSCKTHVTVVSVGCTILHAEQQHKTLVYRPSSDFEEIRQISIVPSIEGECRDDHTLF